MAQSAQPVHICLTKQVSHVVADCSRRAMSDSIIYGVVTVTVAELWLSSHAFAESLISATYLSCVVVKQAWHKQCVSPRQVSIFKLLDSGVTPSLDRTDAL